MVNKPRFTGCPGLCGGDVHCWRANHMPYVGLLLTRYGAKVAVWEKVFARWMRFKKLAWPDEVEAFWNLYESKHKELFSHPTFHRALLHIEYGAVHMAGEHFPRRLFGDVLSGEPYTPKKNKRQEHFFRLAAATIKNISLRRHSNEYRSH
jgi:hypothetical protein